MYKAYFKFSICNKYFATVILHNFHDEFIEIWIVEQLEQISSALELSILWCCISFLKYCKSPYSKAIKGRAYYRPLEIYHGLQLLCRDFVDVFLLVTVWGTWRTWTNQKTNYKRWFFYSAILCTIFVLRFIYKVQ